MVQWKGREDIGTLQFCYDEDEYEQSDDVLIAAEFEGRIIYDIGFCRRYKDGYEKRGMKIIWSKDTRGLCKVVGWKEIEPFDL